MDATVCSTENPTSHPQIPYKQLLLKQPRRWCPSPSFLDIAGKIFSFVAHACSHITKYKYENVNSNEKNQDISQQHHLRESLGFSACKISDNWWKWKETKTEGVGQKCRLDMKIPDFKSAQYLNSRQRHISFGWFKDHIMLALFSINMFHLFGKSLSKKWVVHPLGGLNMCCAWRQRLHGIRSPYLPI